MTIGTPLKTFHNLLLQFLIWVMFSILLFTLIQSPIGTSAFFHEKLFGSQSPSSSEDNFVTYQDPSSGVALKYPSDWQKIEAPNSTAFRSLNDQAAFDVQVERIELPEAVIELPEQLQSNVEEAKMILEAEKLPGFKLVELNTTTIDGNPAHKLIFLAKPDLHPEPDRWFKFMDLVCIEGDRRYFFLFAALPASYDKLLPTVEKMIDSIKLTTMY
jgi:hypothetical protein